MKRKKSDNEIELIELIKAIFFEHGRKFGFRRIKMELERKYNVTVNHKKIIRIMKEFGMKTKIRRQKKHSISQTELTLTTEMYKQILG